MAKDEKSKNKKNVKEQKSSFFKESKSELKRVSWPTPKALVNDTTTVIGIVLFVAIIVIILDFIFIKFNENVVYKAEKDVRNKATSTQVIENQTNNGENSEENNNEDEHNHEGEENQEQKTTESAE